MARFKFLFPKNLNQLAQSPGVYCFKDKAGKFLYIGKAGNIKQRVKNHFQRPGFKENLWLETANKIGYIEASSEIEALLLEARLIKKYQPKFNVLWRDDKNYFYIGITKDDYPRVFVTHQPRQVLGIKYQVLSIKRRKILNTKYKIQDTKFIGPFVDGRALKQTLKILRRVFPYYTVKKHPKVLCPYCHLGLCPGPSPDRREYQKNIKNLIEVLRGKRKQVLKNLKKEMKEAAQEQNFEKAAQLRDKITALEKVISQARIFERELSRENWQKIQKKLQKLLKTKNKILRIEAYDVSNIQGQEATGSMITFIKGRPDKNFYRRFKVKISGKPNDTAMLREIIQRRFEHPEWPFPDLILIDGGQAQLNVAAESIKYSVLSIKYRPPIIALAKKKNELYLPDRKKPIRLNSLSNSLKFVILQLRDEAHRFAISYHRKLRKNKLLPKYEKKHAKTDFCGREPFGNAVSQLPQKGDSHL